MSRAQFITLEGTEGAGKTTCLNLVADLIKQAGHKLLVTREPGGTQIGEELRELLLSHKHSGMSSDTELLLMFAARAEHLRQKIEPALHDGYWVLCDRFTDATYAYQGGGRGMSKQRIAVLEEWVQSGRKPDLTLLLDLPIETGLERAGKRSAPDRFESEKSVFFQNVRRAYLDIAAGDPGRVKIINAEDNLAGVEKQVRTQLAKFMDALA